MLQRAVAALGAGGRIMDSLRRATDLNHRLTVFPLGFPMALRTNDPRVLEAASTSWGLFAQRFAEDPIDIRVIVDSDANAEMPP